MPAELTPIPVPPAQRWRVFRVEKLPLIVFALGVVAVVLLWRGSAVAPALVAEAEIIQTEVRSARGGVLLELAAEPLQTVRAGQVLGRVRAIPAAEAAAEIAHLRAELDSLAAGREPIIAGQRLAADRERIRLDWMRERAALAALRMEARQAEADLARQRGLHARGVATDEALETARNLSTGLAERLVVQERLVLELAPREDDPASAPGPADESLAAALRAAEAELRFAEARVEPETLLAPVDGIIVRVVRHAGETIIPGEPVLYVAPPTAARLVGFIRQPVDREVRPGMVVEVRTRDTRPRVATAAIQAVGRVLEPVPPTLLALLDRADSPELGLRVHFSLPPDLDLRPGEQVDVMIARSARKASP